MDGTYNQGELDFRSLYPSQISRFLPSANSYHFTSWRLAFEVELELTDVPREAVPPNVLEKYEDSEIFIMKQLRMNLPSTFSTQLLIVFVTKRRYVESALRFKLEASTVPGLLNRLTSSRDIRARREALVHYLQACYFKAFERANYHVIASILITEPNASDRLTSFKFQMVPFNHGKGKALLEGLFGRFRSVFDRNSIVLLAVKGEHTMPLGSVKPGANWVGGVNKESPHGTKCYSYSSFLKSILASLEKINRQTTLIAEFSGVEDGEWDLSLRTWSRHSAKSERRCAWRWAKSDDERLKFEWKNRDEWRYWHESHFSGQAAHIVDCKYSDSWFMSYGTDAIQL